MKNIIKKLENIIKVTFQNKNLLIQGLTHKSFDEKYNNEKLEFLGDRVIGLVISKKLFIFKILKQKQRVQRYLIQLSNQKS